MNVLPSSPSIRLIVVGDEILSGRYPDEHFSKTVELLTHRGLVLSGVEFLPDDFNTLVAAYQRSFAQGGIVFSCGGIGATPDDRTRQAAARALNRPLALHPQAAACIIEHCVEMARQGLGSAEMTHPENQQRLQMGMFPVGCEIVPNPYNRIPGFFINDHTFVPGFPAMAWPMIQATLDTRYKHLHHLNPRGEVSFLVFGIAESRLTPAMQAAEQKWPNVQVFSLPNLEQEKQASYIDLGVKGPPEAVAPAAAYLREQTISLGGTVQEGLGS